MERIVEAAGASDHFGRIAERIDRGMFPARANGRMFHRDQNRFLSSRKSMVLMFIGSDLLQTESRFISMVASRH